MDPPKRFRGPLLAPPRLPWLPALLCRCGGGHARRWCRGRLRSRLFPWAGVVALVAPGQRRQHTGTGAAAPGNKSNGFLQPFPKKRNSRESAQDRCSCCRAGPACSQCAGASSGCRRCRSRAWPLLVRWCCRCCRAAQDLAASRALALRRCRCGCRPLPLAAMAAGPRAGAGDRLSRVRRVLRWWRRGLLLLATGVPARLLGRGHWGGPHFS